MYLPELTNRFTAVVGTALALLVAALATVAAWPGPNQAVAAIAEHPATTDLLQEKQPRSTETREYYGVNSCKKCHTTGFDEKDTFICRGSEIPIWRDLDKHAFAYKALTEKRAKDMGNILGGNVHTREDCLACHSVVLPKKPGISPAESYRLEEGVSCVACHGPDVTDEKDPGRLGWVLLHGPDSKVLRQRWRNTPPDDKDIKHGMTDLWDPAKRTTLCASCHIGNAEMGRVVTHEMYAAGHPPLPSFEVVSFSSQMPPHWQNLRDKDKSIRELVMKFRPGNVDLEQTELLAIGGLVTFQEYVKLLAAPVPSKDWPELANYSCYACHHDLQPQSWRQQRKYLGIPGRPPMQEWPTALVDLGLFQTAAGDMAKAGQLGNEFQAHLLKLQKAVDKQPFGDRDEVNATAKGLVTWINAQLTQLQKGLGVDEAKAGYAAKASELLLARLAEIQRQSRPDAKGNRRTPDYDSARQLAWAFHVLHQEAASKPGDKLAKDRSANPAWEGLDKYLRLTFPKGQTELESVFKDARDRTRQYEPTEYFKLWDAVVKKSKS